MIEIPIFTRASALKAIKIMLSSFVKSKDITGFKKISYNSKLPDGRIAPILVEGDNINAIIDLSPANKACEKVGLLNDMRMTNPQHGSLLVIYRDKSDTNEGVLLAARRAISQSIDKDDISILYHANDETIKKTKGNIKYKTELVGNVEIDLLNNSFLQPQWTRMVDSHGRKK